MGAGRARASLVWDPITNIPLCMHPTACYAAHNTIFSAGAAHLHLTSRTLTGFGRRRVKLMADDGGLTFILDVAQHQW